MSASHFLADGQLTTHWGHIRVTSVLAALRFGKLVVVLEFGGSATRKRFRFIRLP
jgi:hypothetical protein